MSNIGWLIYQEQDAKENDSFIDWFMNEAQKQELSLKLIFREHLQIGIVHNENCILHKSQNIQRPNFAIVRTIDPLLNVQLETLGITVFNSAKISMICNHKAWTHYEINKLQIPMMDTFFYKKGFLQSPPLAYPFVLKEATGRGGKQVYYIENETDWANGKNSIRTEDVIVQTCHVQLGKDLRVFVVGKQIIGAVLRESKTDFRANFKLGGSAKWYSLNVFERNMIHKIIDHFDFGFVGIDFLIDLQGNLIFNEIEDVVGSRTLSKVSDINILQHYVTYIKNKIKS